MSVSILIGDALATLREMPDASVHCCVTSPPYFGLRDYGVAGQMGLEATPDEYVSGMVALFAEVRRVLRDDGTLWLNIGDSYSAQAGQRKVTDVAGLKQQSNVASVGAPSRCAEGCKPKDLIGIPWLLAFALRADGWYLRQDIIWSKPNPMPESVRDRCTKAHEYLFLLSKGPRYFFDGEAIAEAATYSGITGMDATGFKNPMNFKGKHAANPEVRGERPRGSLRPHDGFNGKWDAMSKVEQCGGTRNKRSVWTVATQPFSEAHFATFPPDLIQPCILAGCPVGGTVLDPFGGAGTTGLVADRLQRNATLIELNPEYAAMARRRIDGDRGGLLDAMEAA